MTRLNKEKGSKSARSDTVNTLIHLNLNYFLEMFKEDWTDLKEKKKEKQEIKYKKQKKKK